MTSALEAASVENAEASTLDILRALERKVLWLSSWMIHHANHIRPSRDGLKVGGHQASSASVATIITALYFDILRPEDRVAIKPHASPVFHAIQYLLGYQTEENLRNFRALGGAQSYPSRTKDGNDVDFSTGSVGLGAAMTSFAALVQDYLDVKGRLPEGQPRGRMVAIVGDAELDEGNIYEALLEGWKHDIRNVWWVIDYNRQSLDSTVSDQLYGRFDELFEAMGWRVVTAKYGSLLKAAFKILGGGALREWIDNCPNSLYSALCYKGAAWARGEVDDGTKGWREHLTADLGDQKGIRALLADLDDAELHRLMTNLAGHDMATMQAMFRDIEDDRPTCFIAYTIKGFGLPFEGHKDNHAGLMNPSQIDGFRKRLGIEEGEEWDRFAGLDLEKGSIQEFLDNVDFARKYPRRTKAAVVPVPKIDLPKPSGPKPSGKGGLISTQAAFGQVLDSLARGDNPLADIIVTTSPDVTVSTNLGSWVNRRGIFDRHDRGDAFKDEKVVSAQQWRMSQAGQHIELGIAENNLFLLLAALGLSHETFGARLLPIGTLYDPFIQRGLDALNYACYQGARFMLVATPSGISLAPEGGAHQSISTPLIGMAQDGMAAFEPAFADELAALMAWSFDYMQRDGSDDSGMGWLCDSEGGSVYLRLSTRAINQIDRSVDEGLHRYFVDGAYWLKPPDKGAELAIVYTGAVAPEALEAWETVAEDIPGAGLLAVTSADRLNAGWAAAQRSRQLGREAPGGASPTTLSHVEYLLASLAPDAGLVTVLDGHPATLSWLGAVYGHRVHSLGVEHFGQSGDIPDLYRTHRIDTDAILDACATVSLERLAV